MLDVIIVGAGISGINTAWHIKTKLTALSYTIFDARSSTGSTCSLFKCPGIRSDTNLHTFGLPSLAKESDHVTTLQRSPGYIMNIVNTTGGSWYHKILPRGWSLSIDRWIFMWLMVVIYYLCRLFPERARQQLQSKAQAQLPPHIAVDHHFTPMYDPWTNAAVILQMATSFRLCGMGTEMWLLDIS